MPAAPLTFAVVDPDGTLRVETTDPAASTLLAALQAVIGGPLEYVPTGSRDLVAYVDEEGALHGRQAANPVGTLVLAALGSRARHAAGWLVGPLVLCGSRGPAEVDLTPDQLDRIRAACAEAVVTIYRTHHPAPSGPASA